MTSPSFETAPVDNLANPSHGWLARLERHFRLTDRNITYPDLDVIGTREGSFWGKPNRFSVKQRVAALALTALVCVGAIEHSRVRTAVGHLPKATPEFEQKAQGDVQATLQPQYKIATADQRVEMTFINGDQYGASFLLTNGSGALGFLSEHLRGDPNQDGVWVSALDPDSSNCLAGGAYDTSQNPKVGGGPEGSHAWAESVFGGAIIIVHPKPHAHMSQIILENANKGFGHLEFDTRDPATELVAIASHCIPSPK